MTSPDDTGNLGLELAELLLLIQDWLSTRLSFDQFMPADAYTADHLRIDLLRFAVLLGADIQ
ncbi:hypothetical protein [Nocardia wallacei]|uniref:hypothetical protein n=1 Tax=Nocardia wallacei TaxID=480035 RepID=UPI0024539E5F|nr:hypothetical protein [Nocardia wallacei]